MAPTLTFELSMESKVLGSSAKLQGYGKGGGHCEFIRCGRFDFCLGVLLRIRQQKSKITW
jgi:hypothetical protein